MRKGINRCGKYLNAENGKFSTAVYSILRFFFSISSICLTQSCVYGLIGNKYKIFLSKSILCKTENGIIA